MHGGDLGECLSWVRAATRLSIYPSICRLIGSDFFTSDETRRETFDRSFTFQIGSDPTPSRRDGPTTRSVHFTLSASGRHTRKQSTRSYALLPGAANHHGRRVHAR